MSYTSAIFNHAARVLRLDYPEAMRNMTLVDSAAPDRGEAIVKWDASLPAADRSQLATDFGPDYINNITLYDGDFAYVTESSGQALISVSSQSSAESQTMRLRVQECVFHEAGHFITAEGHRPPPPGASDAEIIRNTLKNEIAADVFMALTEIKYELHNIAGVQEISNRRSLGGWLARDLEHDTSLALNTLLQTHSLEKIKSMSPDDIVATADHYARKFTPSAAEFPLILHTYNTAHEGMGIRQDSSYTDDDREAATECLLRLANTGINRADRDSMMFRMIANSVNTALNANSSKIDKTRPEWEFIRTVFAPAPSTAQPAAPQTGTPVFRR